MYFNREPKFAKSIICKGILKCQTVLNRHGTLSKHFTLNDIIFFKYYWLA